MKKKLLIILAIFILSIMFFLKNNSNSSEELDKLKALPYVVWTEENVDENISGVIYNSKKAYQGYNLYLDEINKAYLMNMEGNIVHNWTFPFKGQWEYAAIHENGDIIGVCVNKGIVKLDWNSDILWENRFKTHHDIEILPNSSYLVPYNFITNYNSHKVLFDSIALISNSGEKIDEWSTYKNLENIKSLHYKSKLEDINSINNPDKKYDYYHLNTIKILPKNKLEEKDKRFQKGNWLISLRNVNLILILDKDTQEIVWNWGIDSLDNQHYPIMLENGNIMIFDNGRFRDHSRVIEINPTTYEIEWEYKKDPSNKFYSKLRGSAQPLPNGNVLITESEKGHVFEVTRDKEIVWDFYNPEIKEGHRKRIYRMIRYPLEMFENLN